MRDHVKKETYLAQVTAVYYRSKWQAETQRKTMTTICGHCSLLSAG